MPTPANRAALQAEIASSFPTNGQGQITAAVLRPFLNDFLAGISAFAGDGVNGQILTVAGGTPTFGPFIFGTNPVGGTLPVGNGGTGQSTAQAARSAGGLNVDNYTGVGDTNYTVALTDRVLSTNATLTAPRTWTLPLARLVNPGQVLFATDGFGGATSSNTITIQAGAGDTINAGGSVTINTARGAWALWSTGGTSWVAVPLGSTAVSGVTSVGGLTGTIGTSAGIAVSGSSIVLDASAVQGFLSGFQVLNLGGTPGVLQFGAGACASDDATQMMKIIGGIKTTNFTWTSGFGPPGSAGPYPGLLDQAPANFPGASLETMHLWAINRPDTNVTDVLGSLAGGQTATVSISVASPAVVTWASHGMQANQQVQFSVSGGGLPTGIVANTVYYVLGSGLTTGTFQIAATAGGAAINTTGTSTGTQTALSVPTLPTSYTKKRRIASLTYGPSTITFTPFVQNGDRFDLVVPFNTFTGPSGTTSAQLQTVAGVPQGVSVEALLYGSASDTAGTTLLYLSSLYMTDEPATATPYFNVVAGSGYNLSLVTSLGGQIRARTQTTTFTYSLNLRGYVDRRGK